MTSLVTPHRLRLFFRLHTGRLQRRTIFLFGGIVVGAAAVALAIAADQVQEAFRLLIARWRFAAFLITPAGFALSVYLTNNYFDNSEGSGIPQAIAARALNDQTERGKLVSIRIAIGKIILTLLGLLCGASVGREGPTVQVGASIMFAIGRLSPRRQRGLILAGAAAGISAAFNTPLAGIVFGIEEMSRSFEVRTSGLIVGGIIAAGITSLALLGNYTYFGTTNAALPPGVNWLAILVCGVAGGALGGIFSRILIAVAAGLPGKIGKAIKRHPILFAAACGLAMALCGFLSDDTVYGTGYSQVKAALQHGTPLPWSFGILKMVATTLSSISGIPGGLFSPSLAVGAGMALNIAPFFPTAPLGAIMLLGMVSYFTGVVQAPITAFVIVSEMTDNTVMIVPLMMAALIAHATSNTICREGVYHALSKNYLPKDHPLRH